MVGMVPRLIGTLLGPGELTAREIAAARIAAGLTSTDLKAGYAIRQLLEESDEPEHEDITLPVSSSAIYAIGWRRGDIIIVHFKRGGHQIYTYDGTYELFQAFALAPSKGKFFNEHFRR